MNREQIEKELYGDGGLLDRIVDKINEITPRKAALLLDLSTQNVYAFLQRVKKNRYQIKSGTMIEYAEELGVK